MDNNSRNNDYYFYKENCNKQLEEFNYFNGIESSITTNHSQNFLNEFDASVDTSILDTINSIINDGHIQETKRSHLFHQNYNKSLPQTHRTNSVDSDIWDKQNTSDGHHQSITTINSNNDLKLDLGLEDQVPNFIGNINKNLDNYHPNFSTENTMKSGETTNKGQHNNQATLINGVSEMHHNHLVNISSLELNFSKSLESYKNKAISNILETSVNPAVLAADTNLFVHENDNIVQEKIPGKVSSKRKHEDVTRSSLSSLNQNCKFINELDFVTTTKIKSKALNHFNFADEQFDNADFCSVWVSKSNGSKIVETCQISSSPKSTDCHEGSSTQCHNKIHKTKGIKSEPITEISDWLDTNAQKIYEDSSDYGTNHILSKGLPRVLPPLTDLPKMEQVKHMCDGCFKINRVSYGCSKQLVKNLPNIDAFKEYNSPNKYTLKFALENGNSNFSYVNSEVKTRYDPSIKRYSTKILYSSKGKKLKRDYPSLCPFCKVSDTKKFDSLFYERNNSCYRGHLINTHGINSTGERAKLPKSGFVSYKLGKNSWSETVGFNCPYNNCDQCFLKGDKTHGFHEYIRHWNRCHIMVD